MGRLEGLTLDRARVPESQTRRYGNATYALAGRSGNDKRIVTGVGTASPDRAKVTVGDNGVAIAPDDMTRIFNHCFTTKKDGHGFGLHNGANAAKEMVGTLTAQGDGAGEGAEFTLELLTAASARQQEHPAIQGKT